jgi:hypothetical protein
MVQILRLLSFVPLLLAANIRREERQLVRWFRARGALDRDRAVTLRVDGPIRTWVYQRLLRNGVIKPVGENVYLEESGYTEFRRRRRHRAVVVLALALLGLAIAMFRGDVSL